jgi:hypothetical protein
LVLHLVRSGGSGQWNESEQRTNWPYQFAWKHVLIGDFDGSGSDDLIFLVMDGTRGLNIHAFFSMPYGRWEERGTSIGWGSATLEYPALVGDVDGDRRADLVFPMSYGNENNLEIRVLFSTGRGQWRGSEVQIGWGQAIHPAMLGDVNGDRRADLIFPFHDGGNGLAVRTLLSDGNGQWTQRSSTIGWGFGIHDFPTLAGDINGDQRTDLIFPFQTVGGLTVRTLLSNGDGSWLPQSQEIGWGAGTQHYQTLVADIDGDRKLDLIFPFIDGNSGLRFRFLRNFNARTWTSGSQLLGDGQNVLNRHVP